MKADMVNRQEKKRTVRKTGIYPSCQADTPYVYSGGTTYCALASLRLLYISFPETSPPPSRFCLTPSEVRQTLRWLVQKQKSGFQGRTEKDSDACYCFWCGASIKVRFWILICITRYKEVAISSHGVYTCPCIMYRQLLAGDHLVDSDANATFLSACQYKYGGIAKEPGETSGELLTSATLRRSTRDPLTHFFRSLSHISITCLTITLSAFKSLA